MPCYYQSVSEIEIKDEEILKKAFQRLSLGDYYHQKGLYSFGSHSIKIEGNQATIVSTDYGFAGRLKQAYGVEAAKKELKKRGMRYKEIQVDNKIRLVVRGG